MTPGSVRLLLDTEATSILAESDPEDLSPLERLYLRGAGGDEVVAGTVEQLREGDVPPVWELALALAAAGERAPARSAASVETTRSALHWAALVTASPDPVTRLAWAYALRRIGIAPRPTEAIGSLFSAAPATSLCLPSGLVFGPPEAPSSADLTATIRTGVLGLLLGLRTESAGLLALGKAAMTSVARLVSASGALWWPAWVDAEAILWAACGLSVLAPMVESGLVASAASRMLEGMDVVGMVENLDDVSIMRLAVLWAELPEQLVPLATDPADLPHIVSLPSQASGYCHGHEITCGWNWHGDRWPCLTSTLGNQIGVCHSGPAWCHGDTFLWALTDGRAVWNTPEEVGERQIEGDTLTWSGRVSVESR